MKIIYIINPPDKDIKKTHITKDMAGGFGFNAGKEIVLPSLELIYHAINLRKRGYEIRYYDLQSEREKIYELYEKMPKTGKIIFLVLITTPTLESDLSFIRKIGKINKNVQVFVKLDVKNEKVILKILRISIVKKVLIGETEDIVHNIFSGTSKGGTAYLNNGRIVYAPQHIVTDLNTLPDLELDFLDLSRFRYPLLSTEAGRTFTFQSSRGCPFPCAYYCPYPLIQGNTWRAMSEKKLYRNIELLVNKFKIKFILFRDATFTLDKNRIKEFCEDVICNNLKFNWWCETRINCLDEELLKIMKKAGCLGMNIGVETGDQNVMEIQGKPGVNLDQLTSLKEVADKIRIKLHFLMIIGLPYDSWYSLTLTFKLIKKLKPYSLGVTVITPYPGTLLYNEAKKKKWIENNSLSQYSGNLPVMHTDNLTSWEIKFAQKLIQAELILMKKGILGKTGLFIEERFFEILTKIRWIKKS